MTTNRGPHITRPSLHREDTMTRSQLITSIWRERGCSDVQRRIDEKEAAKVITDDSVDHKRYKVYIDSIKRDTEKAILADRKSTRLNSSH